MKRVISVSKTYKHRGLRQHRDSTKKFWFVYYYDEEMNFCSEQVSFAKAMFYKGRLWHRMKFICLECGRVFMGIVRNKKDAIECPYCEF